jgi:hypothetical protein
MQDKSPILALGAEIGPSANHVARPIRRQPVHCAVEHSCWTSSRTNDLSILRRIAPGRRRRRFLVHWRRLMLALECREIRLRDIAADP